MHLAHLKVLGTLRGWKKNNTNGEELREKNTKGKKLAQYGVP
jgi:hypothetical protein